MLPEATAEIQRFPSLASVRAAHTELLKRHREQGDVPELIAAMEDFIRRGQASGALIDSDEDRLAAQSLLDYWATRHYRTGRPTPDATLAEFDPNLAPELSDALCPYVGLNAFRGLNQGVFFGRQKLIEELLNHLRHDRLLAVLGASGSGKSSVVRAGLIPSLERGVLDGSADAFYFPPIVPGSNPLANLARLTLPPNATDADVLGEAGRYRADARYLVKLIAGRFSGSVVFLVDQFEEAFTLCFDDDVRKAFVDNLVSVTTAPNRKHLVLLTMRTDFESQIVRLPDFQPLFEKAVVRVMAMSAKELREAIEGPAKMVGLKFEEGLVDSLIHDVLGEEAALPLLQFTLLKLWERRERNRLTWTAYRKLGGGRLALSRSADEFYNNLIPEDQETAKRILLKLVQPGEGREVTSHRVRRLSLYTKAEASDRIDRVLAKLVKDDLVRLTKGETDTDDQVEVAHEALVRNWPRLVGWLEDERINLRQRRRLTSAAEQWLRLDKDPGALRRGALLQESLQYDDLNLLEAEFVQASVAAEQAAEEAKRQAQEQAIKAEMAQKVAEVERQRAEEQARAATRLRSLNRIASAIGAVAIVLAVAAGVLWIQSSQNAQAALRSAQTAQTANTQSALNLSIAQTQQAKAEFASTQAFNSESNALANARVAQNSEQLSRARLWSAQGRAIFNGPHPTDPLLGLRLALEGLTLIPVIDQQARNFVGLTVRDLIAQGRVLNLGDNVENIYPNTDNSLFVVDRKNAPGELRRTRDGSLVALLTSPIRGDAFEANGVVFSSSAARYFAMTYTDGTGELRRAEDGVILTTLKSGFSRVAFSPDPQATYLMVTYPNNNVETIQLYRTDDGSLVTLAGTLARLIFSPDAQATYFAALYTDQSADIRRTMAERLAMFTPAGRVSDIWFSRDSKTTYFAVRYRNGAGEVRRMADLGLQKQFQSNVESVEFPDPEAVYIRISYTDDTGEFRRIKEDTRVFSLTGRVNQMVFSPAGRYFALIYANGSAELRRTASSTVPIRQIEDAQIQSIDFPDPGERYFITYDAYGRQELRRTTDGRPVPLKPVVTESSEAEPPSFYTYEVTFSPDAERTFFAVRYYNHTAELYRTADGQIVTLQGQESGNISFVSFSNDPAATYLIVNYADAPTELYRIADGTRAAQLNDRVDVEEVVFSRDPGVSYFAVVYSTALGEVWTTRGGRLRRLAPLGIAAFQRWFDTQSQRLIVRYYDDRAYVFDLQLLGALDGSADRRSLEDLARLACAMFAREQFDVNLLGEHLKGAPPRACPSLP